MNVLIDIILISVFIYFVIKYFKAGLLVTLLSIWKPFASLLLALMLGNTFSGLIFRFLDNGVSLSEWVSRIISLIIAYSFVFVVSYVMISIIISLIADVKMPVISQIDRSLGAVLGIFVGLALVSVISTGAFSVLSALYGAFGNDQIMAVYNDSIVFKNVYNLRFLDFIKELI